MDHVLYIHIVTSLLVLILLPATYFEAQCQVTGPSQPIVATVGDDIILPCHLEPAEDASGKTVEWTRSNLDPRFVYVWRDGGELEDKKHPSYRGRTSVFIDQLKLGDISLKLSRVKLSDEGRYKCFNPELGHSFIELVVGSVSSPFIVSIERTISGLVLQCESKGWYPEPEVSWLDGGGHVLSARPTETVRGPDDLYTVSSRVTVEKRHSDNFTCRVQQRDINQTRETQICFTDNFLTVPPRSDVCIIVGVVASVTFLLCGLAFAWWKWKQTKSRQNLQLYTL